MFLIIQDNNKKRMKKHFNSRSDEKARDIVKSKKKTLKRFN